MTNIWWIIILDIRTLIVSNLVFPYNTILSCFFFFFFLIIDLYFLIPKVIAKSFTPTEDFVIATGAQTNEANAEMGTKPVTVESKTIKCST